MILMLLNNVTSAIIKYVHKSKDNNLQLKSYCNNLLVIPRGNS